MCRFGGIWPHAGVNEFSELNDAIDLNDVLKYLN